MGIMKKHLFYRFPVLLMTMMVMLTGVLSQKVTGAEYMYLNVTDVGSSSATFLWNPIEGATDYKVIVYGINTKEGWWQNYTGYPVTVKSPVTELKVNNIGYYEPFWDDDRKVKVEAYASGTLLTKVEKDFKALWPGPMITGITNITYDSFTVSWNNTVGNLGPWHKAFLTVLNDETGEEVARYENLTVTSQAVTGLSGGIRYKIRLQGYKSVYFSYYDEWRDIWSEISGGTVYTKLQAPVALPALSIQPNAFMAQWNKTSGAKKYRLYVKEKASGRMVINGDSTTILSWWVDKLDSPQEVLESGLAYEYQVSAVNDQMESVKSNVISVTTEMLARPEAKQATLVTDHSFKAWWNPVPGATLYRLEILMNNSWVWRFTTETSYEITDIVLKHNTEYKYRVRAIFNTRISYYGNEITVRTRPKAPVATPATNITNTSFTARWDKVFGAPGYKLWVISTSSTGLNPKGYFPKTLGDVSSETITGLVSGIEYMYYVQSVFPEGESMASGIIYVTTTGATTYSVNLSATPAGGGVVSGGGTFAPGKSVTITATVNPGYEFVNWTEGTKVLTTNTSYTFTVSTNRTLVANFRSLPSPCVVSLSANPADGGTVSGGGTFNEGTSVSVKASTASGYEFVNWTKGSTVVSTSSGYIFTVKESTTLVANFRAVVPAYTLTLASGPVAGGTVSGGGTYSSGTEVVVKATPAKGYEFVNWTEGTKVVSTNTGYVLTLLSNRTLTANFRAVAATYSLSLTSDPFLGGTTDGGGNYAPGTTVSIAAIPDRGYEFVNWTEGGKVVTTSVNYKFTLNGDRSLTANFREKAVNYTVGLSASPAAGGTVSGGGTFTQGSSVTVTATPASGYEFVNWTEGTTSVSTTSGYTFTLNGNRSLTANFRQQTVSYTLGVAAAPVAGGTVSGGGTFTQGSSVTVTAAPAKGYLFVNWTEGTTSVSTSSSYIFTMNGNRTLTANFTVNTPVNDLFRSEIKVWPNPVTSKLHVQGVKGKGLLKLSDISGRSVYQNSGTSPEWVVPMERCQPGIYLLIIETVEGRQVRKIVRK
jgi:hypothetical protein